MFLSEFLISVFSCGKGMENFETDLSTLHPILTECRVTKSNMELVLIQYANEISSAAHVEVKLIRRYHFSISECCRYVVFVYN